MSPSQQLTIEQALSKAKKAAKQGDTAIAVKLYNAILQKQPNHSIAKKGLRKLQEAQNKSSEAGTSNPSQDQITVLVNLYNSGQMTETEQACRELLQAYPQSPVATNILGVSLIGQGRLQEAVASFDKAIQIKPDYTEAHFNRGNALKQLGQLDDAVKSYGESIQLKPDFIDAYYNRGNTLKELGNLDGALFSYNEAIRLKPDYAEAYNNQGNTLKELGHREEALKSYLKAIEFKPDYATAYNNCGALLKVLRQPDKAIENYDKAIKLEPDNADAYNNKGSVLAELEQLDSAIASCNKAIQLDPDFPEAYNNRGSIHFKLGHMNEAIQNFDLSIQLKPDYAIAYNNRANALKALGQLKEAYKSYEKAVEFKPDYAEAHLSLALSRKYSPDDPHAGLMENLLTNSELIESDRTHLYVALAKISEDIGNYDDSFSYLEKANLRRSQELDYSIDNDRQLFARIKEVFSAKGVPLVKVSEVGPHIRPLFIIGMPRSGTSLVEQILATHSKVHGAGELETIGTLMSPIISSHSDEAFNQDKAALFANKITSLRHSYLEALALLNVPETVVVDKMPYNFLFVGFILSAFPNAKIIHLGRDPIATCWSIYKHFFVNKSNGYAYDMDNLAEYYSLYRGLMSFWRELFPESIYELCYEHLTENQEEQSRKIFEFCELDWEEQCLEFYKTERAVKTASAAQVRQKMYKGSSEAWRKYEKHLQMLINSLQDHTKVTN